MIDLAHPTTTGPTEVQWYYLRHGEQCGPISEDELIAAARLGQIQPTTLVWHSAFESWKQASVIPMLAVNFKSPRAAALASAAVQSAGELQDAVLDGEDDDPPIDTVQARQILARASGIPPEPSIPPASARTPLPSVTTLNWSHAAYGVGIALFALSGLFLMLHWQAQRSSESASESARRAPLATEGSEAQAADSRTTTATRPIAALPQPRPAHHEATTSAPAAPAPAAPAPTIPEIASPVRVIDGPLTAEPFLAQLKRSLPLYDQQCWDRLRTGNSSATANPAVQISLSVDRTGHVYDISSSKAPAGYRGAGLCIIGRMRGWRFPPTDGNTHASVLVARTHP
jgi:hypothetical protein